MDMDLHIQVHGIIEKFSQRPVTNFGELCQCPREILHPIIPGDPKRPLSTPPDIIITKG